MCSARRWLGQRSACLCFGQPLCASVLLAASSTKELSQCLPLALLAPRISRDERPLHNLILSLFLFGARRLARPLRLASLQGQDNNTNGQYLQLDQVISRKEGRRLHHEAHARERRETQCATQKFQTRRPASSPRRHGSGTRRRASRSTTRGSRCSRASSSGTPATLRRGAGPRPTPRSTRPRAPRGTRSRRHRRTTSSTTGTSTPSRTNY